MSSLGMYWFGMYLSVLVFRTDFLNFISNGLSSQVLQADIPSKIDSR